MNTQKNIWVAVAVVVLGGAWYLFSSPGGSQDVVPTATTTQSDTTGTQQTTPKPTTTTRPAGSGTTQKPAVPVRAVGVNTLSYLYSLKQPLVCTVTVGTTVKRSGTMYIADAKMRVNFSSTSMIDDGSFLYVWTRGAVKGLKLSSASSVSGSAIAANGGFDPANPFSFSCNSWIEDASVFSPPTAVTFSNTL